MFISDFSIYFVVLSPFDHVWVYWSDLSMVIGWTRVIVLRSL